jgi:hypothetical protein
MSHAWASALIPLVLAAPAAAQFDPTVFSSPSGVFELRVDPSEPDGAGPADTSLWRDGELVWAKRLRTTCMETVVTDGGVVLAVAHTQGLGRMFEGGDLVVTILDPMGSVRFTEVHPRGAVALHSPDQPWCRGVMLLSEGNGALVRLMLSGRHPESWRFYDLSAGEPRGVVVPEYPPGNNEVRLVALAPIQGTPLLLAHWLAWGDQGSRFQVLDRSGSTLWSLNLPGDHSGLDPKQQAAWENEIEAGGAITCDRPGGFSVVRLAEGLSVSYAVARQGSDDPWVITEGERRPFAWSPPPEAAEPTPIPIELKLLGTVELEGKVSAPAGDILAWTPTAEGVEAIMIDGPWTSVRLVRIDLAGEQRGQELRLPPDQSMGTGNWARLTSGAWLLVRSYTEGRGRAWRFEPSTGEPTELEGFGGMKPSALATTRDGGFALIGRRGGINSQSLVAAYDARGRKLWLRETSSPEDVTVLTTGQVAVLDGVGDAIEIYDPRDGTLLHTIDLVEALGGEPTSLSGLQPAPGGELLLYDFDGDPNLIRLDAAGKDASAVPLRFEDGHGPDILAWQARYGPKGRLWSSDGRAWLRFGAVFEPDLILGDLVRGQALEDPRDARVGPGGRLHVMDGLDGAVHVFDRDGRQLHRCVPGPDDLDDVPFFGHIAVDGDGHVFLARDDNPDDYLEFDREGRRLGLVPFEGEALAFHPISKHAWLAQYQEAWALDRRGRTQSRLRRRADRRWFRIVTGMALGEDGSLAVADASRRQSVDAGPALTLFTPDGTPRVTYPVNFGGDELVRGRGWAATGGSTHWLPLLRESDGTLFVFETEKEGEGRPIDLTTSPDHGELWVFDRGRRVLSRYAWPEL